MPTRFISTKSPKKTTKMSSDKESSPISKKDTNSTEVTPSKLSLSTESPRKRVMKRNRTPPVKLVKNRKSSASLNDKLITKLPKKSQPRKHVSKRKSLPLASNKKQKQKTTDDDNTKPLSFPSLKNLSPDSLTVNKKAKVVIKEEPGLEKLQIVNRKLSKKSC